MELTRREALMSAAALRPRDTESVPQVPFGKHRVSRLIVGGNPVSGTSHLSGALSREMRKYFTVAGIKQLLRNCEAAGINTWQSRGDRHIMRTLEEYRDEGGRIQWIGQTASELADTARNIRDMADAGAIGVYLHGVQTDRSWKQGRMEYVRDMLKVMRQAGLQAGIGTHIPEVVDYVESQGWDFDFYMTCLYNLSRTSEEASQLAGRPITDELFWDPDRQRMLERVKKTAKPCLVFKVYGATRKCGSPEQMAGALRQVFLSAKPSDCVVIGMYPKASEQVQENCRLLIDAVRG